MPISLGFWGWRCPKRGDAHITVTWPLKRRQGNWDELTCAKTSGTVTRHGKNWPIADRYVTYNDLRSNCGTRLGSSSLVVSKVANGNKKREV